MKFSTKLSIVITAIFLAGFSAMFFLGYTSTLFMGICLVMILSTFLVTRAATKPLNDLGRAAAELGKGKRDVSVRVRSKDEIGLLAKAFNAMVVDLKESENKYKDMAELLPQTVFEVDARGTITFVNRHTMHTFGFTEQDVAAGMNVLDVVAPGDHARLRENMAKVLAGERMENIEYTAMRKDGSLFPFLSFVVPVTRDGTVAGMRGIGIDIAERKRAEDELRQREWQLSEAQRLAHLGSWVWRVGEDSAAWTDELYRMLGLNPWNVEPMVGTYLQFVHPDDRAAMEQAVHDTMVEGMPTSIEHRIIKKDGVVRFFHSQTDVVRDDAGKPVLIRGIVRDITERKRAENDARERESFLTNIFDSIQDVICILDEDLRIVRTNATAEKIFSHTLPLAGRKCHEAYHGRTEPCEDCPGLKTLRTGKPDGKLFSMTFPGEKSEVWIELFSFPLLDETKSRVTRVIEYARNITARKWAEEALRESEERYRSVVDNVGIGIALISPNMEILSLNRQMKEWSPAIDVSQRPICFRSFNRPPREEICSYCPTIKTLRDGLVHEAVTETPVVWGIMNLRIVSTPLKDSEGNVIAAIEMVEDVTARKRTEDEIKKLNEELERKVEERTRQLLDAQEALVRKEKLATLGQIAGSVGHELRNPLGVMSNAVYYLQTVLADGDDTVREYLGIIKKEIFGAERIVSDLLDAVRTKPPCPQLVSADTMIRMSLEKCRIPENITVDVQAETQLPVSVDPFQMKQVFVNLINNAVEAMPGGGELKIRARLTGDEGLTRDEGRGVNEGRRTSDEGCKDISSIEFSVADTGRGITPDVRAKLFQPLFTTKTRGIGLGLVVVKNLTEANGGKTDVSSEVGKGTMFTVILPCAAARNEQNELSRGV